MGDELGQGDAEDVAVCGRMEGRLGGLGGCWGGEDEADDAEEGDDEGLHVDDVELRVRGFEAYRESEVRRSGYLSAVIVFPCVGNSPYKVLSIMCDPRSTFRTLKSCVPENSGPDRGAERNPRW